MCCKVGKDGDGNAYPVVEWNDHIRDGCCQCIA